MNTSFVKSVGALTKCATAVKSPITLRQNFSICKINKNYKCNAFLTPLRLDLLLKIKTLFQAHFPNRIALKEPLR